MSFLKRIVSPRAGDADRRASLDSQSGFALSPRSPSFNEMSMGAHEDLVEYEAAKHDAALPESPAAQQRAPVSGSPLKAVSRRDVWRQTFNPGRNYSENMRRVGGQYWDSVEGERGVQPSIWDHVLQSERRCSFDALDKDKDGFLSAEDLARALGRTQDVAQLIAAADRNGDGRIDRAEFQQVLEQHGASLSRA